MLTFAPAFRITEEYAFGPVTVHIEEGVIGYVVDQVDYASLLGCEPSSPLVWAAQEDILIWAQAHGRELTTEQRLSLDREHGLHQVMPLDDVDALAVTLQLWARERREAFFAEADEEQRAISAGELAYD